MVGKMSSYLKEITNLRNYLACCWISKSIRTYRSSYKNKKIYIDLYKHLEKEFDHSAGLRINGALSIAQTDARWQELGRQATMLTYDVDLELLNKDEIKNKYMMYTDDLKGGVLTEMVLLT